MHAGEFLAPRHLANAALVANAVRPVPGTFASFPAMFAGWLTGELAPHLLAATAVDAGWRIARRGVRAETGSLMVNAVTAAGYAELIRRSQGARREIEDALHEAIGDYHEHLPCVPDLATPWRSLLNPFRMGHVDVVASRKLPYSDGGRRFELDVYRHRDANGPSPVLLQIHGGGWVIGEKEQQGIPLMMRMAALGWTCVAINYPLSPKARWPQHIVAVKRAIAWIREHADEHGADTSFIAVTGGSAGGHLAALAALTANDPAFQPGFEEVDTRLQACVPNYGVYDFTDESGTRASKVRLRSLVRRWVMASDARYPDDYHAASPLFRVHADAPPFFVLHGTNDTLVPIADARAFVSALREVAKAPVAYAELRGAQHAYDIFSSIRAAHVVRGAERFLEWARATNAADRECAPRLP
ncbi:MAG TPA: alpha/beta hydrolase [Jatrophihabitans sp.]